MAASVACAYPLDWSNAVGPSPISYDAIATVYDDGEFLPPGSGSRQPVADVRLELETSYVVIRHAVTDASGRADLGRVSSGSYVRAVKDQAWGGLEVRITNQSPVLVFSQAPHTVWGFVNTRNGPAPGVLVRFNGGPNDGTSAVTDSAGFYRIDTIVSQGLPVIDYSKAGFRTVTARLGGITRNEKLLTIVLDQS